MHPRWVAAVSFTVAILLLKTWRIQVPKSYVDVDCWNDRLGSQTSLKPSTPLFCKVQHTHGTMGCVTTTAQTHRSRRFRERHSNPSMQSGTLRSYPHTLCAGY
eukprot:PhF_6_TR38580/c1_g2_i1/m.57302